MSFERTVEVAGEEKTVELEVIECDNCGGDMEVPTERPESDGSLCSVACIDEWDATENGEETDP